jgi:hypothetical protein
MPHWMLTPIDHRAEIWKTYLVQRIVVEAATERAARQQFAKAVREALLPNPWLDPAVTSCEAIEERQKGRPGRCRGENAVRRTKDKGVPTRTAARSKSSAYAVPAGGVIATPVCSYGRWRFG